MNEHEVYPNAPLVLVALEVRHPATEDPSPDDLRALKSRLATQFPVMRRVQEASFQFTGPGGSPETVAEEVTKFFNRENTISISMRSSSIVIEATDYPGWESFRAIAANALVARTETTALDGVERVGLRYIDEIRVPRSEIPWDAWLAPSVLGPQTASASLPLRTWQGNAVYGDPGNSALVLRYGAYEGAAVESAYLRRIRAITNPSFFLLDIDSYWTPNDGTPEFATETVLEMTDELHNPVRSLFESLITPRYRDEVLRNVQST
jgi:uncharacterized protein (TIGR04255 family)